jgi:hypothetical protein
LLKDREFGSSAGTLHAVLMELATNDLKYGIGMSEWRFFLVNGEPPRIGIRLLARSEYTRSPIDGGRGRRTIAERIDDLDGRIAAGPSIDEEVFSCSIRSAFPRFLSLNSFFGLRPAEPRLS